MASIHPPVVNTHPVKAEVPSENPHIEWLPEEPLAANNVPLVQPIRTAGEADNSLENQTQIIKDDAKSSSELPQIHPQKDSAAPIQPSAVPGHSSAEIPSKADVSTHQSDAETSFNAEHIPVSKPSTSAYQQEPVDPETSNVGWSNDMPVPAPVVSGLLNEDLWLLLRRFNQQIYHVKALPGPPPGGLDLNIADEEEFSPDKLRATIERLYMSLGVGAMGFFKHVTRLRSWNEANRTLSFCVTYFLACYYRMVIPLLLLTVTVLIAIPRSRNLLFPYVPPSLINSSTGTLQTPAAGALGSKDSMSGAAEMHRGEAVEQEASNLTATFASIAISSATGQNPSALGNNEGDVTDATNGNDIVTQAVDAKNIASSGTQGKPAPKHDKTKQPIEDAMWSKARPFMHTLADMADGWERFANLLSPTKPFDQDRARLKLVGILIPLVASCMVISPSMVSQASGFLAGFGFFGQPVITRILLELNTRFPDWTKALELRNSILHGVPTNAQLTIALLRIAEASNAPLPPPPVSTSAASETLTSKEQIKVNAEVADNLDVPAGAVDAHANSPNVRKSAELSASPTSEKKKTGRKVSAFLKGTAKAGVSTLFGINRVKATAGSELSKQRLGILPASGDRGYEDGPSDFVARYHGKKGLVLISTSATSPCVSFSQETDIEREVKPVFTVALSEITELKKLGGLSWKGKLIVGFVLNRDVTDGIAISVKTGESFTMTAIPRRDELFNRLLALGGHQWEAW